MKRWTQTRVGHVGQGTVNAKKEREHLRKSAQKPSPVSQSSKSYDKG